MRTRSPKYARAASEDEIVRLLRRRFSRRGADLEMGIGDDAAVIHPRGGKELWLLTTDLLLEEIHFERRWTTPRQLGHKCLAVNLSDIAAMGGCPRFYTVALGVPRGITSRWIESFYEGLTGLGRRYQALLVGGDLSRSESGIHISIAVLGETIGKRVVYRSGGCPGDLLYVTGTLGKSSAGLRLLKSGRGRGRTYAERLALKAHLEPEPRCGAGLWLALKGFARALMDLSDGLSIDLSRMCEASGTGAEIYTSHLPLFQDSKAWVLDPLSLALHGGEDYELLFAVSPSRALVLERIYPHKYPKICRIGRLTPERGVFYSAEPGQHRRALPKLGFDHFRSR